MKSKSLSIVTVFVFHLVVGQSVASETFQYEHTISDHSGRTINVVLLLKENSEGNYSIVRVEPKQEAILFFNRACEEELGSGALWARVAIKDYKETVSSPEHYAYTCHRRHSKKSVKKRRCFSIMPRRTQFY